MVQTTATKKAGKNVNSKHVDSLLSNYKKQRWASNSEKLGKADSLSVWYSIDELHEFVANAKENGADGIKIYFGVYAEDTTNNTEYQGRQTVVLVASKVKETANGSTFDKSIFVAGKNGQPEILAYNVGRVCPPYCGGGVGTGTEESTGFDLDNPGILIDKHDGGMIIV